MFRKILHANDGSERAFEAFAMALRIAKKDKAELHMVSVAETGHMPKLIGHPDERTQTPAVRFENVLKRARSMAGDSDKLHTHVLSGHPVHDIVKLATELKVDLIVVGSSGHSSLYDRMIGSRAQKILHHAPCPVLVVK
jgi:nucleotide-binding universal stress UspA family protein